MERIGVQAKIKDAFSFSFIHTLQEPCSESQHCVCLQDIVNEVFQFLTIPQRDNFNHVLDKFELETKKEKIQGLCRTRWVERHTCFETLCVAHLRLS